MIVIRLPPTLAERAGVSRIELPAASLGESLSALTARYPALSRIVWNDNATLNPVLLFFRNNQRLLRPALCTVLSAGDEIDIVPSIEAG